MSPRTLLTVGMALAFAVLLGYININSGQVQLPMFCLLLFSFVLGAYHPRAAWRWGILMGLSLPISYWVAFAVNYPAVDAPGSPLTLVVLVIPALLAAWAGAFASRQAQPPEYRAG